MDRKSGTGILLAVRSFRASLEVLPTSNTNTSSTRGQAVASSCLPILARDVRAWDTARGTDEARQQGDAEGTGRRRHERNWDPDGEIRTPLNPILPPNLR